MRTWGRVVNPDGSKSWVKVTTDEAGFDTAVWLTTLCQVLLLNLNESPFFANYGLADQQAIIQQIAPDFYVARTQQLFAPYFASLIVARVPGPGDPVYKVAVVTLQGSKIVTMVPF